VQLPASTLGRSDESMDDVEPKISPTATHLIADISTAVNVQYKTLMMINHRIFQFFWVIFTK
jgi:hypothetical protein